MIKETTCCFSGHRPMKLPWGMRESDERCLRMQQWIREQILHFYDLGYRDFLCGMAIGCDTFFARAVLELKSEPPGIRLHAAVPCADQPNGWNRKQKEEYERLLAACDSVKTLQMNYSPGCMQKRNEYMIDVSSALIACYNGRPGGTMTTIVLAERAGLDTKILDISEL